MIKAITIDQLTNVLEKEINKGSLKIADIYKSWKANEINIYSEDNKKYKVRIYDKNFIENKCDIKCLLYEKEIPIMYFQGRGKNYIEGVNLGGFGPYIRTHWLITKNINPQSAWDEIKKWIEKNQPLLYARLLEVEQKENYFIGESIPAEEILPEYLLQDIQNLTRNI